jgi:AcrR family transcriptional regulator
LLNSAFTLLVDQGPEFTVQELVEHASSSYRAFYDSFESKDGLFLAMFEEATTVGLRRQLDAAAKAGDDPVAQLREFILCRWRLLETGDPALSRAMVSFHLRLSEARPDELVAVLQPTYDAILELVMACQKSGQLREDLTPGTCAAHLLQTSLMSIQGLALGVHYGGQTVSAEATWDMLERGMFDDQATRRRRGRRRP